MILVITTQPAGYQPDPNLPPWANGILAIIAAFGGVAGIIGLMVALRALLRSTEAKTVSTTNAASNTASIDRLSQRANSMQEQVTNVATAVSPPTPIVAVPAISPPPTEPPRRVST